jgi:hypothetical protein
MYTHPWLEQRRQRNDHFFDDDCHFEALSTVFVNRHQSFGLFFCDDEKV